MENNKRKLTRNSYKRKIVVFGIAIFMSVALVATGFAAWVISTNVQADTDVGVSVGTVSNPNFAISFDDGVEGQKFVFEPAEADTVGKVRNDGENFENLTVVITGKVTNAQFLGALKVTVDYTATNLEAVEAATYIVLADDQTLAQVTDKETLDGQANGYYLVDSTAEPGTKEAIFKVTLTITWGEYFEGENPGYYYDGIQANGDKLVMGDAEHTALMAKDAATIEKELKAFYDMIMEKSGNVKVTVSAETN